MRPYRKPIPRTEALIAEIRRLYDEGLFQREIGERLKISTPAICMIMREYGIVARPRSLKHRLNRGIDHPGWKGDAVDYNGAHARVRRERGTPKLCDECKTTDPTKRYDWASDADMALRPHALRRLRRGADHHGWKGDDLGYTAAHKRVRVARGTPQHCESCGTTDPSKPYDWAYVEGNRAEPTNYRRLCRLCHVRFDNDRRGGTASQRRDITPELIVSFLKRAVPMKKIAATLKISLRTMNKYLVATGWKRLGPGGKYLPPPDATT